MRIERFGSGFISPERDGTDGYDSPLVPKQSYVSEGLVKPLAASIGGFGLLTLGVLAVLLWPGKRRKNGTSERGSVMAVSGERAMRNPASSRRASTRTRTEVRSPTRTSTRTEVRSPTSTSTSTRAHTSGNFTATVTGGAGSGNTSVTIRRNKRNRRKRR